MPLNTDKLNGNSNSNGKGFAPNSNGKGEPKPNQPKQTEANAMPTEETSLALISTPVGAIDVATEQLADQMIDAATRQAQEISNMVLSYTGLVADLVQQNLAYAKEEGMLGKSLDIPKFTPSVNSSALLRSRLQAHSPKLLKSAHPSPQSIEPSQSENSKSLQSDQDYQTSG